MSRRVAKKILTPKEAALAKAMFLYTDKNNQQILSYFVYPGNDINSRVMTQLRKKKIHTNILPTSKEEMEDFIRQRENQSLLSPSITEEAVILYQPPGQDIEISVRIDESKETVWLTQVL